MSCVCRLCLSVILGVFMLVLETETEIERERERERERENEEERERCGGKKMERERERGRERRGGEEMERERLCVSSKERERKRNLPIRSPAGSQSSEYFDETLPLLISFSDHTSPGTPPSLSLSFSLSLYPPFSGVPSQVLQQL